MEGPQHIEGMFILPITDNLISVLCSLTLSHILILCWHQIVQSGEAQFARQIVTISNGEEKFISYVKPKRHTVSTLLILLPFPIAQC